MTWVNYQPTCSHQHYWHSTQDQKNTHRFQGHTEHVKGTWKFSRKSRGKGKTQEVRAWATTCICFQSPYKLISNPAMVNQAVINKAAITFSKINSRQWRRLKRQTKMKTMWNQAHKLIIKSKKRQRNLLIIITNNSFLWIKVFFKKSLHS